MQENSNSFSMQEALRLAKSPAGQQLLALLQKNGGDDLKKAMNQAASGNYDHAKTLISNLLSSSDAQKLLSQLEEK